MRLEKTTRALLVLGLLCGSGLRAQGGDCPDDTDTPQILTVYVGVAYRALANDPTRPPPAPCLLAAVAKKAGSFADSVVDQTLALDSVLLKGSPNDPSLLETRMVLSYRRRRHADVKSSFNRLLAVDPSRGTLERYRIAITASELSADTAGAVVLLASSSAKFPDAAYLKSEYDLIRQIPRMRALIDSVHRAMADDPRKTGGFTALASIYGNLGQTDSALAYIKRGRAAGVPKPELAGALRSMIGGVLRRAQLQDSPEEWEAALPMAFDVDSAYSSNETKYFVAVVIAHVLAERIELANFYRPMLVLTHGHGSFDAIDVTRPATSKSDDACASMAAIFKLADFARERMTAGGNLFAPESNASILGTLGGVTAKLNSLYGACR
jgi:hypothetical protein